MQLRNTLKDIPEDELLYIGAVSSYFFIGTKAEFAEDLEGLNKFMIGRLNNALQRANASLRKENRPAKIERIKSRIKELEEELRTYIPLENREVRDQYSKFTEDEGTKGTVLLIEGVAEGRFWFKSEYEEEKEKIEEEKRKKEEKRRKRKCQR